MTDPTVPPPSAPPGWYADGATPGVVRWFDGRAWTPHVQQVVPAYATGPTPPAGVGASPSDPIHWLVPTGRSWESIAAGYLGLIGLVVWPLAPFAVVTGVLAFRRAARGGHGRGRATFGIVTGLVGSVIGLVALVSWMR